MARNPATTPDDSLARPRDPWPEEPPDAEPTPWPPGGPIAIDALTALLNDPVGEGPLPWPDRARGHWRRAAARLAAWRGRRADLAATRADVWPARLAAAATVAEVREALVAAAAELVPGSRPGFVPEGAARGDGAGPSAGQRVPVGCGDRRVGALELATPAVRRAASARLRRLEALATLAAAVEVTLDLRDRPQPPVVLVRDPVTGLHTGAFLDAFLDQAVALARRRGEPLALLVLGLDRLDAVAAADGPRLVHAALAIAARALTGTLRSSDLVARIEAERFAAVLPGAAGADALRVAEVVRRALAEAGITSGARTPLTASIGLVTRPGTADDADGLRRAATAALARAQRQGGNRVEPA